MKTALYCQLTWPVNKKGIRPDAQAIPLIKSLDRCVNNTSVFSYASAFIQLPLFSCLYLILNRYKHALPRFLTEADITVT